jgi:acyl dehydratase
MTTYPLPEMTTPEITRTMIARYAGASGDMNPLHTDETFATALGHPGIMAHGMLTAGIVGHHLTRCFGPNRLRRYKARFRKPVFPGDVLHISGTVEETGPEGTAAVEVTVTRGDGAVVLEASAAVDATPTESGG